MPHQYFWHLLETRESTDKNPSVHCRCTLDIFSNITDRGIQRLAMLVVRKIGQVGPVGCTNDWHNCHSSRKLILHIPPPITYVHLTEYLATFRVWKAHRFEIEVRLKWEMC